MSLTLMVFHLLWALQLWCFWMKAILPRIAILKEGGYR